MSEHAALAGVAAREWGLPEPQLLRTGMNSLFAAGDDVVIRVGNPPFGIAAEVEWVARMSRLGVRVPELRRDIIERDGVALVALEHIRAEGTVDWAEVGSMIRRVHEIDPDELPRLPWCGDFPHWQIDALLREVGLEIDLPALVGIEACLEQWHGWRDRMRWSLVVCHGDLHPGNVLPTAAGPVVIDWDLRCVGPAEWDHGPLLRWGDRWSDLWGGEAEVYEHFAEGYGRTMRGEWLAEAIGAIRLVAATFMRVRAGRTDPAAAAEAERRLRYWRGEADAPLWEPQ